MESSLHLSYIILLVQANISFKTELEIQLMYLE